MATPRHIDLDLVNAQQARRILDRLVGYKLSPFLSGKIRKGLSAGRVQSIAVKIVVDREEEIRSFEPEEYWTIEAKFAPKANKVFSAQFWGKRDEKIKITSEQETNEILDKLKISSYVVEKIKKGSRKYSPSPPFITSTLQQEASRKLGFVPRKTMKIAQELYEGVEVQNLGPVGLITYMRTDSLRLSENAIKDIKEYIENRWGTKYLPEKTRTFKSKANAQDGHEAIRPTMPKLSPEEVKASLSNDQYKLYKLIWERFTACQMANCVHGTTAVSIASDSGYLFKSSAYVVLFDGFTVLYEEAKTEKSQKLPELEEGMPLKLKEITPNQHFTEPPPRYTEASLIKALETNGIGRPSTYAATLTTILGREYVVREAKQLKPTELGETTNKLIQERFSKVVNIKFTAQMEKELDTVEKGKCDWVEILEKFYTNFEKLLTKAKEEMKDVKIHLKEDQTDIVCDLCGKDMVVKHGRYGKFIGCSGYPDCKNIKKFVNETGADCPKCEGKCIARKSKKGRIFYGCNRYPECDFVSWDEPIKEKCPRCNKTIFQKKGKTYKVYCITENCNFEEERSS
jgi:DNA topoisomerase-1